MKVLGYLRTARAVAPLLIDQGWGRIVNISGLAARNAGRITGSIRNVSVSALTKNAIAAGGGVPGAIHY